MKRSLESVKDLAEFFNKAIQHRASDTFVAGKYVARKVTYFGSQFRFLRSHSSCRPPRAGTNSVVCSNIWLIFTRLALNFLTSQKWMKQLPPCLARKLHKEFENPWRMAEKYSNFSSSLTQFVVFPPSYTNTNHSFIRS